MSAATSHGTGLAKKHAAGLRRLGHGPLLVLRHDLRCQHRRSLRRQIDFVTMLKISDQLLHGGDRRCSWRQRPGRARATARSLLEIRGLSQASQVARMRVLRLHDARTICTRPIAACRRFGKCSMTVRASLMPRTSCGAPLAIGPSRRTTAGAGSSRAVQHWNAERVGWHVCTRGDRFGVSPADLHDACRAVPGATAAERVLDDVGLADGSSERRSIVSDHFTRRMTF